MSDELFELLFNGLNEQGYLFQEKCYETLKRVERTTGWEVKGYNYPVSVQGQETKVDIVLQKANQGAPELYVLIECKRAAPEYVHWLFGAPGLPFGSAECYLAALKCTETRSDRPTEFNRFVAKDRFEVLSYVAQNWMEVKKNTKGKTSNVQNIEDAFVQVLRGVSGFAREYLSQRMKVGSLFDARFIPVVITTASLYAAQYEIRDIDERTGTIDRQKVLFGPQGKNPEEDDWLLINYDAGESIAPEAIPNSYHGVDPSKLQEYKQRSIFVVNSRSISLFFSKLKLTV